MPVGASHQPWRFAYEGPCSRRTGYRRASEPSPAPRAASRSRGRAPGLCWIATRSPPFSSALTSSRIRDLPPSSSAF